MGRVHPALGPSAVLLEAFAYGASALGTGAGIGWIQGLKAAAVAVVAHAVLGIAPDRKRATIAAAGMILAILALLAWKLPAWAVVVAAGAAGLFVL